MMLGAVDTVMLSQYSDNSVAAVGVVNQLIMFAFLIFEVINIGTSVLCSQYLGARMHKNMVQVVGVSLILNLAFGLFVSAILHYGATSLLSMMGLRPELMEYGVSYMKIVGAFAFFQAISLTISASLRSANKAVYPMMVTVVVNILNIIGNYSLIFGKFGMPALGVEGAAISTAFARGVSMVILFVILFRKHIPRFPLSYFCPFPFVELKNLLKIGVPSAGENMSYSFSQVVLTYFINMLGNEALALGDAGDAELPHALGDDRRGAARDDRDLDAVLLQHLDAESVAHVEALVELARARDVDRAVAHHAVDVEYDHSDAGRALVHCGHVGSPEKWIKGPWHPSGRAGAGRR